MFCVIVLLIAFVLVMTRSFTQFFTDGSNSSNDSTKDFSFYFTTPVYIIDTM
uniref:Uncharacterized protein n=1 Tax=Angiostrongylus cantonensis TaxID=6313 RepID=A0A0K0DAE2_ANGCA